MPQRRLHQAIGAEYVLAAVAIAAAVPLAYAAHGPAWSAWLAVAGVCLAAGLWVGFFVRRRALQRLEGVLESQRAEGVRFHTAINNMSQGLCFFDGQQRLIVCNRRFADMYGLTMDQVNPGTTLREIVDHRFNAGAFPAMSRDEYLVWRKSIAVSNQPSETVTELRDGRVYAIHHQPMPDGGWVATHEDITQERRALAQIEHMARSDALTELPNRVQFRHRLVELLRPGGTSEGVAILFIDLDRFKAVNDTLGHPAGDELLRAAARRLCRCVRQMDMVARLGGDEFAIIQSGAAQPLAAQALAERLLREFAEPFDIGGHQVRVGASVGIALSPADGTDPDALLKNADLALYEAKAAGRGGHRFFRPQMVEQAQGRRTLEFELREALAQQQFELRFQPIVELASRAVVAFEALPHWQHPSRGLLSADAFIGAAEECGLVDAIGAWALNAAVQQAASWPEAMALALNLSPMQRCDGHLPAAVAEALRAAGLPAHRLQLEISEPLGLMQDSAELDVLQRLQAQGVRIVLDDFGVGPSSLSHLRSLRFERIKIHPAFVRDVVHSAEAAAIVQAVAALAASLGMTACADGVEREDQLERVRALGCHEAQGPLLGAASPAHALPLEPAA